MDITSTKQASSVADLLLNLKDVEEYGVTFIYGKDVETTLSYKMLYHEALKVLYNMQAQGVERNSKVIFQLEDNRHFILSFWACMLGGFVPVPLPVAKTIEDKKRLFSVWHKLDNPYMIGTSSVRASILESSKDPSIQKVETNIEERCIDFGELDINRGSGKIEKLEKKEVALIQFSSGSTGTPKGVVLTHSNLVMQVGSIRKRTLLSNGARILTWMPLTHDMGLMAYHLFPVLIGCQHYIMTTSYFVAHPLEWVNNLSKYRVHMAGCPNYGFKYFLDHYDENKDYGWNLSTITSITNSGEPVSFELCEEFVTKLAKYRLRRVITVAYGLAEATLMLAFKTKLSKDDAISINRNCIGVGHKIEIDTGENSERYILLSHIVDFGRVRICDEKENILEDDTIGCIQISGPMVTKGYYNDEKSTKAIMTSDRWLNTGDLGFLHEGSLVVIGRLKDIIFVNGKNYYLTDVDRIVEEIEGVNERAAACNIYNDQTQRDEVIIFVEENKGKTEDDKLASNIKIVVSSKLGLRVDDVVFVEEIPRTESGKIKRYALSEMYREMHSEAEQEDNNDYVAPCSTLEKQICAIWGDTLDKARYGMTDNFFECGGDSIAAQVIASRMYEELQIKVAEEEIYTYQTVQDMMKHVKCIKSSSEVGHETCD